MFYPKKNHLNQKGMQITTLFYTSSHKCHSCFDCIQGLQQRQTRLANVMLMNCDNIYNKYICKSKDVYSIPYKIK